MHKLYEGFMKDWVMRINNYLDIGQYGGPKGVGTEHMIVCLLDKILKLLDQQPDRSAVIAASMDWLLTGRIQPLPSVNSLSWE